MAKLSSRFFSTMARKASYYAGTKNILVHSGVRLFHRGQCIGSITHNKDSGEFEVSVVNGADALFMQEFKSFAEADRYAWVSFTSA